MNIQIYWKKANYIICCNLQYLYMYQQIHRHWNIGNFDVISIILHTYLYLPITLNKWSEYLTGHGKQLAPGCYRYPFDYCIPKDNMHSSFEGHHGATRWFIKIEIGRPMPHSNIVKYKCFTYLANVDIDQPLYAVRQ